MRRDVLVQLHGDGEVADRLQRFMQLDLAAIDVEALLRQSVRQVARSNGTEELIVLTGTALE